MYKVGQKVAVNAGGQVGVIVQVSTWKNVLGEPAYENPVYFVRVPAWDNVTNGGRWMGECCLSPADDVERAEQPE